MVIPCYLGTISYNDISMLENITLAKKYWKIPWSSGNLDNIQIYIKFT